MRLCLMMPVRTWMNRQLQRSICVGDRRLGGTIREKLSDGMRCTMVCSLLVDGSLGGESGCKKSKKDEQGVNMSEEQSRKVCKMGQKGERMFQFVG